MCGMVVVLGSGRDIVLDLDCVVVGGGVVVRVDVVVVVVCGVGDVVACVLVHGRVCVL